MTLTIVRNLLIALALAATAAPLAAAGNSICVSDYDATSSAFTCVDVGSSTWGSCDGGNGGESTGAGLRHDAYGNGSYSSWQTGAGASCYSYTFDNGNETYTGGGNGIGFHSYRYDSDGGYGQIGFSWYAYEGSGPWGSYEGCDMQSDVAGQRASHGCPLGNPPRVPVLP